MSILGILLADSFNKLSSEARFGTKRDIFLLDFMLSLHKKEEKEEKSTKRTKVQTSASAHS